MSDNTTKADLACANRFIACFDALKEQPHRGDRTTRFGDYYSETVLLAAVNFAMEKNP